MSISLFKYNSLKSGISPTETENKENSPSVNSTGARLTQLKKDTVSFGTNVPRYTPARFADYAARIAEQRYNEFKGFVESVLNGVQGIKSSTTRVKDPRSSFEKAHRKLGHTPLPLNDSIIPDIMGARALTDGTEKATKGIFYNLANAVKQGKFKPEEIEIHKGENITPYVSDKGIEALQKACAEKGLKTPKITYSTNQRGYTSTHITGEMHGIPSEFQIRGNKVEEINDATHLYYDLKKNKVHTSEMNRTPEQKAAIEGVSQAYNSLVEKEDLINKQEYIRAKLHKQGGKAYVKQKGPLTLYEEYIASNYRMKRMSELSGHDFGQMHFPEELAGYEALSIKNLTEVNKIMHKPAPTPPPPPSPKGYTKKLAPAPPLRHI